MRNIKTKRERREIIVSKWKRKSFKVEKEEKKIEKEGKEIQNRVREWKKEIMSRRKGKIK